MTKRLISSVSVHNAHMQKLRDDNFNTAPVGVRQFSNPFLLQSTNALLTQILQKGTGVGAGGVPTTSQSMGSVAQQDAAEADPDFARKNISRTVGRGSDRTAADISEQLDAKQSEIATSKRAKKAAATKGALLIKSFAQRQAAAKKVLKAAEDKTAAATDKTAAAKAIATVYTGKHPEPMLSDYVKDESARPMVSRPGKGGYGQFQIDRAKWNKEHKPALAKLNKDSAALQYKENSLRNDALKLEVAIEAAARKEAKRKADRVKKVAKETEDDVGDADELAALRKKAKMIKPRSAPIAKAKAAKSKSAKDSLSKAAKAKTDHDAAHPHVSDVKGKSKPTINNANKAAHVDAQTADEKARHAKEKVARSSAKKVDNALKKAASEVTADSHSTEAVSKVASTEKAQQAAYAAFLKNDADNPNVSADGEWQFRATRDSGAKVLTTERAAYHKWMKKHNALYRAYTKAQAAHLAAITQAQAFGRKQGTTTPLSDASASAPRDGVRGAGTRGGVTITGGGD